MINIAIGSKELRDNPKLVEHLGNLLIELAFGQYVMRHRNGFIQTNDLAVGKTRLRCRYCEVPQTYEFWWIDDIAEYCISFDDRWSFSERII